MLVCVDKSAHKLDKIEKTRSTNHGNLKNKTISYRSKENDANNYQVSTDDSTLSSASFAPTTTNRNNDESNNHGLSQLPTTTLITTATTNNNNTNHVLNINENKNNSNPYKWRNTDGRNISQ